jgi:membrane protease YdiL (CAAX protease family)
MSAKLLSKARHQARKVTAKLGGKEPAAEKRSYEWNMLLLLPLWVTTAYVASIEIVRVVLWIMDILNMPIENLIRPAIVQTLLATVVYALTIAIVISVPYIWRRKTSLQDLGINRLPYWSDIGLSIVGFIIYSVLIALVLAAVTAWIPAFPVDQAQDTGFKSLGSQTDNMLAFLTLVVLAPIAEETLFRGYLYGKLKSYVPAIWAALATSLLFAIAHQQWNVGVDVFVLSMILCWLRSLTGSIWAGVLVHMIKNGLAYYLLFISPIMGG